MKHPRPHNTGTLLLRLLTREMSVWQLVIYFIGVFTGMFILLSALQFYLNLRSINDGNQGLNNTRYVVLSGKVNGLSFAPQRSDLQPTLDQLRREPWVVAAAPFTTANFNVTASVEFAGRSMSTALFLESVPNDFIDELPEGWTFNPADPTAELPILLPRDYLALYNFGFAVSRGLPRIGENVIKTIPLRVSASGNGRQQYFNARIAGFSSRLNTIAVPQEFIEWGNGVFGDENSAQPSRIIVEIDTDTGDPRLRDFMTRHNLEQGGENTLADSSVHIFKVISSIVIAIGAVIASLAVGLLLVSIFLLLHKTGPVLYRLVALGYRGQTISLIYTIVFGAINVLAIGLCLAGTGILNANFLHLMAQSGLTVHTTILVAALTAIGAAALITLLSYAIFRRAISKI